MNDLQAIPDLVDIQGFLERSYPPQANLADALRLSGLESENISLPFSPEDQKGVDAVDGNVNSVWMPADYLFNGINISVYVSRNAIPLAPVASWRLSQGLCSGRRIYLSPIRGRVLSATLQDDMMIFILSPDRDGILCQFLDIFLPLLRTLDTELRLPNPALPGTLGRIP